MFCVVLIFWYFFITGNKFGKSNKFQKPHGKLQGKSDKIDGKPVASEKVDWTKFKQEKKELRLKRKVSRIGFDKIHEVKQLYEKLKW